MIDSESVDDSASDAPPAMYEIPKQPVLTTANTAAPMKFLEPVPAVGYIEIVSGTKLPIFEYMPTLEQMRNQHESFGFKFYEPDSITLIDLERA